MNLNEAAEIVRSKSVVAKDPSQWAGYLRAREVLLDTMLSWLDPTPISENWLRENGWRLLPSDDWLYKNTGLRIARFDGGLWDSPQIVRQIKTLGELRTLLRLLRLMGGGE